MKISDTKTVNLLDRILRSPDSKRQRNDFENRAQGLKDKLELSRERLFEEIKERIGKEPDIRVEKIRELETLLETRTYNMRGEIVAKAIIKNHLLDAIL